MPQTHLVICMPDLESHHPNVTAFIAFTTYANLTGMLTSL
jgi:hypothetical protein